VITLSATNAGGTSTVSHTATFTVK
jgi:hypothetical protein